MPERMLLIDVGNTNTKLGLAEEGAVTAAYSLPTDPAATADAWGFRLMDVLRASGLGRPDVDVVVASSVVPPMDPLLTKACRRFLGLDPQFVPAQVPIGLENRYQRPNEVGADRLVTALAARRLTPGHGPVISVDFGTATTFDCVQGEAYLGGLICPGVMSSAGALAGRTAKLPRITLELDSPEITIGRSTFDSLNQGFVHGFAAMTEGIVGRLKGLLGEDAAVVATGGFAPMLSTVCDCLRVVRPNLLLEGLVLAWAEARRESGPARTLP